MASGMVIYWQYYIGMPICSSPKKDTTFKKISSVAYKTLLSIYRKFIFLKFFLKIWIEEKSDTKSFEII